MGVPNRHALFFSSTRQHAILCMHGIKHAQEGRIPHRLSKSPPLNANRGAPQVFFLTLRLLRLVGVRSSAEKSKSEPCLRIPIDRERHVTHSRLWTKCTLSLVCIVDCFERRLFGKVLRWTKYKSHESFADLHWLAGSWGWTRVLESCRLRRRPSRVETVLC